VARRAIMTEQQWRSCSNPRPMLEFLLLGASHVPIGGRTPPSRTVKGTDRKLRLFACECFNRLRDFLTHPMACAAVAVAELFADGLTSADDLTKANAEVTEAFETFKSQLRATTDLESKTALPIGAALGMSIQVTSASAGLAAWHNCSNASSAVGAFATAEESPSDSGFSRAEKAAQAVLLRDLFGPLPFRSLLLDASWLTSTVLLLAQGIYDEKAFDRMPILADCLMDEGCDNEDILNHLRGPGLHSKGCWACDLILGKH